MMLTQQQEFDVIAYIDCYYCGDQIEFDYQHDKVIIKRYAPKPSYDDGNGLDAITFDVTEDAIDLTQQLVDEATSFAKFIEMQLNEQPNEESISTDLRSVFYDIDDDDDLPF